MMGHLSGKKRDLFYEVGIPTFAGQPTPNLAKRNTPFSASKFMGLYAGNVTGAKVVAVPTWSWPGSSWLVPAIPIIWHRAILIEVAGTSPAMTP